MLICNNGELHRPESMGNINTIIRYNISVNDRLHTFNINGPCQQTVICNNAFYVGKKQVVNAISSGNWGNAWPDDTRFINNLFYVDKGGSASFDLGGMTKVVFAHNLFWGQFKNRPTDVHAVISNPRLIAPGQSPLATLRAWLGLSERRGTGFRQTDITSDDPRVAQAANLTSAAEVGLRSANRRISTQQVCRRRHIQAGRGTRRREATPQVQGSRSVGWHLKFLRGCEIRSLIDRGAVADGLCLR